MTLKPEMTSGPSKVTSVIVTTLEPRVHICVPKEESLPSPLKYIDVTRTTCTSLDVLQEKRINEYCNVNMDRTSLDSWTGFRKFTWLSEKPPPGCVWSGSDLRRSKQLPDLIICDSARKLRGIHFIDPVDGRVQRDHLRTQERH